MPGIHDAISTRLGSYNKTVFFYKYFYYADYLLCKDTMQTLCCRISAYNFVYKSILAGLLNTIQSTRPLSHYFYCLKKNHTQENESDKNVIFNQYGNFKNNRLLQSPCSKNKFNF